MRRIRTFTIIFLILLLLMSGCDSAGTQETTLPPETTVPVETTLPPETTMPPETTAPPETEPIASVLNGIPFHEAYEADGFVHYCGETVYGEYGGGSYYLIFYQYAGDSPVIELKSMGITLTLPEGWLDQVLVIRPWNHPHSESVYIINKGLWEAYRSGDHEPGTYDGLQDFILALSCTPSSRFSESMRESLYVLYEHDELVYSATLGAPEGSSGAIMRNDLIKEIGQDAYDELVGDLVLDYETVEDMITFTN